ncbi:MAG: FG-GAP-like repeat-containing protein [Planctomycetota bacterium]|jgi:tetratricopeptide (TPR) repeat protein
MPTAHRWLIALVAVLLISAPAVAGEGDTGEQPPIDPRGQARASFGAGKYKEAWEAYDTAVALAPADSELLNEYAWNLVTFPGKSVETAKRALPLAERAVELDPRNGGIIDTLAEVHFVMGNTLEAIRWNVECRKHSAMSTFFDQLEKYARKYVLELDGAGGNPADRARARAWLAESLLGKRKPAAAEAEKLARESLALNGSDPGAPKQLARSLFIQKKYAEAVEAYRMALAQDGAREDARLRFGLGFALLETGKGAESAVDHIRAALAIDPDLPRGRRTLARAYLAVGDPDMALAQAQLASSRIRNRWQPEFLNEPLLILMAKAWEMKGHYSWAMEFFLRALLTRGDDDEALTGLERTYRKVFMEGPSPREYFAKRDKVSTPFFEDGTESWGLEKASGRRVAFGDADGDGQDDLLFGGFKLWLNEGGKFVERGEAGFGKARGRGGLFADLDNDGDLDVFLAGATARSPSTDAIFLNDGKGIYSLREGSGVADSHPTEGAAFADFDGDGAVDLYVANYEGPMSVGHPDFLLKGRGDGTFEDVSEKSGISRRTLRCGRGVVWADFDNDGDPDLHVSNYRLNPNFLFLNAGDGTFTEVGEKRGVRGVGIRGYYGHTIGSDFGDVDNDGDLDLFQANLAHPRFIEFSDQSFLFLNSGGPRYGFNDVRKASGIRFEETHSDPLFADFDNDGHLDLYVTSVYKGRKSFLYRNQGDGTFRDVTWYAGVRADNGWGAAASDVDEDGDIDLVVCGTSGPRLFINRGNGNRWLRVRVVGGPRSNRAAIGARVSIRYGGGMGQIREIKGGRGTTSQDSLTAHFGLGDYSGVVEVTVRFPAIPNVIKTFENVETNRLFVAREGD